MSLKYKQIGKCRFGNEINDILQSYGVTDVQSFLNPNEKYVESEYLFNNMSKAVEVFSKHIKLNSEIDLLVDCDCDGFTSASVMYQYIKRVFPTIKINVIIHDKKVHGLSDTVDRMMDDNSKLIIIPDAATSDVEECTMLYTWGKEIIILDHHELDENLDVAKNPAVVVNNQLSSKITDKAMTGVGIVYKFCKALDRLYNVSYADDYLDLVTLGMIGDRCDLFNLQSRYYVFKGLQIIRNKQNKNKLISAMVEDSMYSMNYNVTVNGLGYYICPLINAIIRLGTLEDNVYLFESMCNSDKMLEKKVRGQGMVSMSIQEYVIRTAKSYNNKQKKITAESAEKLIEKINTSGLNQYPIIVCNAGDDVDGNFTGLIANKLASNYKKPCLLMRRHGDMCSGSARGFDKSPIINIKDWLIDTGLFFKAKGHGNACGIAISFDNTYKLFDLLSKMPLNNDIFYHVYNTYTADNLSDVIIKNIAKYNWVWGNSVDEPLFYISGITCNKYNVNLLGAKQNKIEFIYHNIKFIKMSKGSSLNALYKDIVTTGDNIEFNIIGKFSCDKDGSAQVIIEDFEFKKSNKSTAFGF